MEGAASSIFCARLQACQNASKVLGKCYVSAVHFLNFCFLLFKKNISKIIENIKNNFSK